MYADERHDENLTTFFPISVRRVTSGAGEPPSLERWARDAAVEESAGDRARLRHLRDAARGDATLIGALGDLAERAETVAVTTHHGSSHSGAITRVAADMLIMTTAAASAVLIPLDRIASIRQTTGTAPLARSAPTGVGALADTLSDLADERHRVQIRSGAAAPVVGEVVAVGADVVTVALDGGARVLVPLGSISEVVVPR
jgi:hypothetical protein